MCMVPEHVSMLLTICPSRFVTRQVPGHLTMLSSAVWSGRFVTQCMSRWEEDTEGVHADLRQRSLDWLSECFEAAHQAARQAIDFMCNFIGMKASCHASSNHFFHCSLDVTVAVHHHVDILLLCQWHGPPVKEGSAE